VALPNHEDYKLIFKNLPKLFKRIITALTERDKASTNLKSGLWAIEPSLTKKQAKKITQLQT
jgi:hypothetical protein